MHVAGHNLNSGPSIVEKMERDGESYCRMYRVVALLFAFAIRIIVDSYVHTINDEAVKTLGNSRKEICFLFVRGGNNSTVIKANRHVFLKHRGF